MIKIYTKVEWVWNDEGKLTEVASDWYWHDGPVALCCGAGAAQTQIQNQQMNAYSQMSQQASQVFGDSSTVFNDLISSFAPTVAAGPSQKGFSAGEESNLNSSAITQTGQAYRNAKSAVGEAESAQGGGNNADLTGGSKTATDLGIAESAANQTSGELSQIQEQNYATGRQNYDTAVQGLANAPNVFSAASNAGNAATNAGNAASNTANQVAQENNSWVQGVTGALGGIASAATGGLTSSLGSGGGTSGGANFLSSVAAGNAAIGDINTNETSNDWVS